MDTVALIGRLLVSLAAVLGVMWLLARRLRRSGKLRGAGLIDVLGRQSLSRNSSVAVVRVGDQALVIGVTDHQVSVLAETDLEAALAATERPAKSSAKSSVKSPAKSVTATATRRHAAAPRRATVVPTAAPAVAQDVRARLGITSDQDENAETSATTAAAPAARGALAGSALSPQTWKQTLESLREMTAR